MPSVLAADCVKAISGKSRSTEVSLVLVSGMTQGQLGYVDTAGPGRGVLPCCRVLILEVQWVCAASHGQVN